MHIECKNCGTTSDRAGICVYCLKDLGSIPKAILAAALMSVILFLSWVSIAAIFEAEYAWVSIVFGALISGAVIYSSHGSGPIYQLIATSFTLFTIFFSDLFVVWYLWEGAEIALDSSFIEQIKTLAAHQVQWDIYSWLFTFLGVSSGFYIWRYS